MRIIFIRHGQTIGNIEKKYIGTTDEELYIIPEKKYPECEIVVSSPLKRCIQTANIIYPEKRVDIFNDLREIDFGDFEGKNYKELKNNSEYQRWIDSNGTINFPNGENYNDFKERCCKAFEIITEKYKKSESIAFVVHGGTIMSILEKFASPAKDFYDYQVDNNSGYITGYDGKNILIRDKI